MAVVYILGETDIWLKKIALELSLHTNFFSESILLDIQNIELTLQFLTNKIDLNELNENTFFIAEGFACQALMRFLSTNYKIIKQKRIGGIIFFDAWLQTTQPKLQEWNKTPIDYQTLFKIIPYKKFSVFLQNSNKQEEIIQRWEDRLEAEVILLENTDEIPTSISSKLFFYLEK